MRVITLHLPEAHLKGLEDLVRAGIYPNRAEAIRMAIRDFLIDQGLWRRGDVYD